ncbi:amidohydrolase family protein [Helicobacter sp. 23-1046]
MIIKDATMCDYRGSKKGCLKVENGIIAEVTQNLNEIKEYQTHEIYEANGKLLMPALIDIGVYPKAKTLSRNNLTTLSKKALNGGFSTLLLFPQSTPAIDNEAIVELVKSLDIATQVHFIPSIKPTITQNSDSASPHKLSDISRLYDNGARCICTNSDIDGNMLIRIAQYAKMLQTPIICLPKESSLSQGVLFEGEFAGKLGLPMISYKSQSTEVAKICEMFVDCDITLLLNAVCLPRSVDIIQSYKAQGLKVHTQVSLHHLILNEEVCDNYNTAGKITPPLLPENLRVALLENLKGGKIDVLSTLQCANFNSQKDQVFELAESGIDCIAFGFALAYDRIFKAHNIELSVLSALFSHNPARILGLNRGSLEVGAEAEFIIVNEDSHTLIEDSFSPYNGVKLRSKVEKIYCNGTMHELV